MSQDERRVRRPDNAFDAHRQSKRDNAAEGILDGAA
jgi:hypothetical protein